MSNLSNVQRFQSWLPGRPKFLKHFKFETPENPRGRLLSRGLTASISASVDWGSVFDRAGVVQFDRPQRADRRSCP
eukprot:2390122-Prymnesium_polylepis.1